MAPTSPARDGSLERRIRSVSRSPAARSGDSRRAPAIKAVAKKALIKTKVIKVPRAASRSASAGKSTSPKRLASRSPTPHAPRAKFGKDGQHVSFAPPSPLPALVFDEVRKRTPTPEIGVGRLGDWPAPGDSPSVNQVKKAKLKAGPGKAAGADRRVLVAKADHKAKGKGKGKNGKKGQGRKSKRGKGNRSHQPGEDTSQGAGAQSQEE